MVEFSNLLATYVRSAAQALGAKLVTEDARLRAAAPAFTQTLADALAA